MIILLCDLQSSEQADFRGIDFLRIRKQGVVRKIIRDSCYAESIKQRLDKVRVVGVTCLGITCPLLTSMNFEVCIMDEAGQIIFLVLNEKPENVEREAEIVAQSGCLEVVTIATNMAGRGTN